MHEQRGKENEKTTQFKLLGNEMGSKNNGSRLGSPTIFLCRVVNPLPLYIRGTRVT
jgi:hypothetical protein